MSEVIEHEDVSEDKQETRIVVIGTASYDGKVTAYHAAIKPKLVKDKKKFLVKLKLVLHVSWSDPLKISKAPSGTLSPLDPLVIVKLV